MSNNERDGSNEIEDLEEKKDIERYGVDLKNPELEGEESLSPKTLDMMIYPLDNINVDRVYYSIYELKRKYDRTKKNTTKYEYSKSDQRNQIVLDSDFQREAVWNRKQKSELIESVLMGLPLPLIYLYEDKKANLIVVDGRQRLTAFFEFMDEEFALTELKILSNISNLKFSKLDPVYQSKLEDFQIVTQVIKPPTPDVVKFQIFDRVNRGGTALNNQEMRNALYQGNATRLLYRLSKCDEFKKATNNGLNSTRMKDRYIILRSLAFWLWRTNQLKDSNGNLIDYKSDIDGFLGKTMEYLNSLDKPQLDIIEFLFKDAMQLTYDLFESDSFRLIKNSKNRKSPINMNVFEVWTYYMMIISKYNFSKNQLILDYNKMISNDYFLDSIGNHRDSLIKVNMRFKFVEKYLERTLL